MKIRSHYAAEIPATYDAMGKCRFCLGTKGRCVSDTIVLGLNIEGIGSIDPDSAG